MEDKIIQNLLQGYTLILHSLNCLRARIIHHYEYVLSRRQKFMDRGNIVSFTTHPHLDRLFDNHGKPVPSPKTHIEIVIPRLIFP